jgi:tyrosyl-tRNA synthetase
MSPTVTRPRLLEELRWRGMLAQHTDGLADALGRGMVSGYCGFDPTASSLHVGNLVPVMGLVHLQRSGHRPIFLAGGGTGMIGDPSGKPSERPLLSMDEIAANTRAIAKQLDRFVDTSGANAAIVDNNAKWLAKLELIPFLRDVGKHFTVNIMMQKDSVKSRMESGVSYTEFSYMLLQAYDYQQLHDMHDCTLQVGGSDQWGNITAGIELIRRTRGTEAHALTFPLLTSASGAKFGKSEAGAVWLDPERTSPYAFYQYWVNVDDRDVVQMLKTFTLFAQDRIEELDRATAESPEKREAQRALAREVTERVHGGKALAAAEEVSQLLFAKGDPRSLSEEALSQLEKEIPTFYIEKAEPRDVLTVLEQTFSTKDALFKSKGEVKRAIEQGGLYLNGERVTENRPIPSSELLPGRRLLFRKGARSYALVRFKD